MLRKGNTGDEILHILDTITEGDKESEPTLEEIQFWNWHKVSWDSHESMRLYKCPNQFLLWITRSFALTMKETSKYWEPITLKIQQIVHVTCFVKSIQTLMWM